MIARLDTTQPYDAVISLGQLERSVLREGEAGQGCALGTLNDFYADSRRVGSRDFGGAKHCVERKHFAVNLGDQEILIALVLTPDLPELNALNRQCGSLSC